MLKIELENRDFRKSIYFYIVEAEKKYGLPLEKIWAGKNMGCGRLPAP